MKPKREQPFEPEKLVIDSLAKSYGKRPVLFDVSLELARGEIVGLLGPNGAGKTTAFYSICGLTAIDHGAIAVENNQQQRVDLTRLPIHARARFGIGYLPQEASIFRGLSVEKNILAILEGNEPNKTKRHQRLNELLDEFGLTALRRENSQTLSGGERRRLEIARCLASSPRFVLLDEPFAGVDPIAVKDIQNLVRHLTDSKIGVLINDHNVRETLDLVERAYVIHNGKVLYSGNSAEIIASPEVRQFYLGDDFRY